MKMQIKDLTDAALDWAVAQCKSEQVYLPYLDRICADVGEPEFYHPSTEWAQGGPIIELEGIEFWTADSYQDEYGKFTAIMSAKHPASMQHYEGETSLIAAMRCYVASKLGDTVDVPDELISL